MTTRLLKENEYLLGKQQVKGTQKVSKRALAAYYQQRPNTTWLGMPWRLWSYHLGQRNFNREAIRQRIAQIEDDFAAKIALAAGDPKKVQRLEKKRDKKIQAQKKLLTEGNVLMRWGEAPVLYSPQQRKLTEQNLLNYLQTKGYFDAHVSSTIKLRDQKAVVTYHIQENFPYSIKSLSLKSSDGAVAKLLQEHRQQSLLKKGALYDQEILRQERERIYELLSNHGYFNFDRQYIWFEVYNNSLEHSVAIETVVGSPSNSTVHPVYRIEEVVWGAEVDSASEKGVSREVVYRGIRFKGLPSYLSPHVLAYKLPLRPFQMYSRQRLLNTQELLGRLGMFRNINITHEVVGPGRLVSHIHTTPVERFHLVNELGLQVSQQLPMPFYKASLVSKSLLGGLDTLEVSAYLGVEGVTATPGGQSFSSNQVLGLDLALSWPQFLAPFSTSLHARLAPFNPRTRMSLGYDYAQRPAYTQDIFKASWSYAWKGQGGNAYEWVPFHMEVVDTRDMSKDFSEHLENFKKQGNNLYRSLQPSWLTLFSFKGIFQKKPVSKEDLSYSALEVSLESGGAMQSFIDVRQFMPALVHYQYIKFDCAYNQHIPVRPGTIFAYRLKTGIARPYGEEKVLPYNRYYFVGSANDVRAWPPRSLGPGTYCPPASEDKHHAEQPGELLLQGSIELRQQLAGILEGAFFVDVGNVWTLREDGRPGGKFRVQDFYEGLAVGTGVGLRLNFRFLVLRLDLGYKLYDPGRPVGERFVGHKLAPGQAVFNFGIGYPF